MRLPPRVPCHQLDQLARTRAVTPAPATRHLPGPIAGFQPHRSKTETTSSIWPTLSARAQHLVNRNVSRNTPPPSNAIYVPNASPVLTTCGPTYAHTRTKDPSSAQSAVKHLRDNTTENDMKACIPAKRSSFAEVSSLAAANGAAVVDSPAQMLLVAISDLKLAESALSHCSTRSLLNVNASSSINRSRLVISNRFPSR